MLHANAVLTYFITCPAKGLERMISIPDDVGVYVVIGRLTRHEELRETLLRIAYGRVLYALRNTRNMILTEEKKNNTLQTLANLIRANKVKIIRQNQLDLQNAAQLDPTLVDRLKVDAKKVATMVAAVDDVLASEDPQGKLLYSYTL